MIPLLTFALPDEVKWFPDLCEPSIPHQANSQVKGVLYGGSHDTWKKIVKMVISINLHSSHYTFYHFMCCNNTKIIYVLKVQACISNRSKNFSYFKLIQSLIIDNYLFQVGSVFDEGSQLKQR